MKLRINGAKTRDAAEWCKEHDLTVEVGPTCDRDFYAYFLGCEFARAGFLHAAFGFGPTQDDAIRSLFVKAADYGYLRTQDGRRVRVPVLNWNSQSPHIERVS